MMMVSTHSYGLISRYIIDNFQKIFMHVDDVAMFYSGYYA